MTMESDCDSISLQAAEGVVEKAQRRELLTQIATVLHNLHKIEEDLAYDAKREWRRLSAAQLSDRDIENTVASKTYL